MFVNKDAASGITKITPEYYYAHKEELEASGKDYMVTGTILGTIDAEHVGYNNTTSGLTSTNLQDAVDELNGKMPTLPILFSQTEQIIGRSGVGGGNVYMRIALYNSMGINSQNISSWGISLVLGIFPMIWDANVFKFDDSVTYNRGTGILHSDQNKYYIAITLIYTKSA